MYTVSGMSTQAIMIDAGKLTVRKGIDLAILGGIPVDSTQAGEGVLTINVHSTRAADTLTA